MPSHSLLYPIAFTTLLMTLGGCSSAPGPWLDHARMSDQFEPPSPSAPVYPVQLITPNVILAQQKAQHAEITAETQRPFGNDPSVTTTAIPYRVQAPDVLSITVYGHPELSSAGNAALPALPSGTGGAATPPLPDVASTPMQGARVGVDGTIFFPTLGRFAVAGKTTQEIAIGLTSALASNVHDPQVDVVVTSYLSQQVQLTGELKTPGTFPITDAPLTVVGALARAGGATPDANLQRVQLIRAGRSSYLNADAIFDRGDIAQNVVLRSGDILNVPNRGENRIFVLGESMKPAAYPMSKWHLTLADALSNSGSIDPKAADPRQIYVIRGTPGQPTEPAVFRLDMTQIDSVLLATQFQLQPLDVVYVGTASSVRFNRILDQVLPTLQALFYTVQLGRN